MALLSDTPNSNRIHIAFFGRRNAGKSTLVNAFCNQDIAIVSATPGTTTDPVSKAMEILPLGPCLITDTAGLDDEGELGKMRVAKSLKVLATTDIAVWVGDDEPTISHPNLLVYRRGDSVEELKRRIADIKIDVEPGLLEGLVDCVSHVVLVCPIDESAPKGRLILPQVQVLRECLDRHLVTMVVQPSELASVAKLGSSTLVITDAQAYASVRQVLAGIAESERPSLWSFSELFARQKGDFEEYRRGLAAVYALQDGDHVLIAEGCTHHRQCNDIGTVKLPKALERLSGRRLEFTFASGVDFPLDGADRFALVVQCGGCMLSRRAVQGRIAAARSANIPIVNYGMVLSAVNAGS